MAPVNAPARRLHPANVGWLLLALALVTLPHVERLPWWITLLAATLIAWRAYITWHGLHLPPKWLLFMIAGGAVGGIYLHYARLLGRDSGVTLLVVMLALKLLEMAAQRDAMVLIFLCYFLVITNFLYSQTIPTALYLLLVVWIITATLIGFQFRQQQPGYRYQLRSAGILLLQSVPLMLVLFVLFPRIPGPLWGLPQDAISGTTGLSDEMSPGSVSKLLTSDAVALRASFRGEVPRANQLYWRGPVMWDFDGYTWTASRLGNQLQRAVERSGSAIEYTVTVEPHSRRWLFALDLPALAPLAARLTGDFQILSPTPVSRRMRYDMTSYPDWRDGSELSPYDRQRALALPPRSNARSVALAERMRKNAADDKAYVAAVLTMFREQNYSYTTTPPLLGINPVDEFLFSTQAGFCEHYASAFAVLMRAGGVPARIVTGYQGGEINYVGAYLTVRQADAHAWTEVWYRGEGWVRVDPTAAVSPNRVEAGVAAGVPQSETLPRQLRGEYEWLQRARMTFDTVTNSWNQIVLEYTQERQFQLMTRIGFDNATWQQLATVMFLFALAITLAVGLLMLRRLRVRRPDPLAAAYARFCAKLARRGLVRHPSEGPVAFARRAAAARPDLQPGIAAISELYVRLRYGAHASTGEASVLQEKVKTFQA
jgi:transglutaminase-like putative cysteine protease